MSNINEKGSAAVEMIYVIVFFLAFLAVVQRFSSLAGEAHRLSINLQNSVDEKMMEAGRPACLEMLNDTSVRDNSAFAIFGATPLAKKLVFVNRPICRGE